MQTPPRREKGSWRRRVDRRLGRLEKGMAALGAAVLLPKVSVDGSTLPQAILSLFG